MKHAGSLAFAPSSYQVAVKRCPSLDQFLRGIIIDLAFFYHSNEGLEIVGIAEVVKTAYQDPTTTESAWLAVDFKPKKKLKNPVTLSQIKNMKDLENMQLVKLQRLSVSAVTEAEFNIILDLSSTKL